MNDKKNSSHWPKVLLSGMLILAMTAFFLIAGSKEPDLKPTAGPMQDDAVALLENETPLESAKISRTIGIEDTAPQRVNGKFKKGSHVKLFLPSLPYVAITHSINGTLVRPANNVRGWEYDVAESHTHIDNRIFEFKLKKGVRFHDGTPFNADAVLLNMKHFKEKPFTYTKLYRIYDRTEKIDDYTVRLILTEPNGVFLHDLTNLPFYTKAYLDKFGWNGKNVCANLAEPGPYALGPYILVEGYLEGDRSTPKVVLQANPHYWGKALPKVETITIYTGLKMAEAADLALNHEGEIDISPIPFSYEAEAVLSEFSKLTVSPSTNHYAVHFNLVNGSKAIADDKIRYAINQSIDKEMLLNLSMLGEGTLTPTMISPHFYKVDKAIEGLEPFFKQEKEKFKNKNKNEILKQIVSDFQLRNGLDPKYQLEISMLVQESFLFLARDIQFFLSQINIKLNLDVVKDEKSVFKQLFPTHKNANDKHWDILIWANFDWFRHPWAAFFVYRPNDAWSSLPSNPKLTEFCDKLLEVSVDSEGYTALIRSFIKYVYQNNYMLFLPNPHVVYAVNKEVVFHPRTSSIVPLWELEVTDLHWSLRKDDKYPDSFKKPYKILRENFKLKATDDK